MLFFYVCLEFIQKCEISLKSKYTEKIIIMEILLDIEKLKLLSYRNTFRYRKNEIIILNTFRYRKIEIIILY